MLLEFFIENVAAEPGTHTTDTGKSVVSVYINFHRFEK